MNTRQTSAQAVASSVLLLALAATHPASGSTRDAVSRQRSRAIAKRSRTHLVLPGQRVGPVRLGDTRKQLENSLAGWAGAPPKLASLTVLQGFEECGRSIDEIDWPPVSPPRNAPGLVFIYLSRGRVFQVQSGSSTFRTRSGLTAGSTPGEVKREPYPLEAYALFNEHYGAIGNRDLIYWVSETKGIAFAFAYEGPALGRRVWTIDIFQPGTKFRPGGCVEFPQEWRKLAPYATALPSAQAGKVPRRKRHTRRDTAR